MKKRILESSIIDDNQFNSDDKDYLYSEYSDVYKEKYGIRPRWVHPKDLSVEELKQMLDELYDEPGNGWADDFEESDTPRDYKGNENYYDDMKAKDDDKVETDKLVNLGSEEGEEFHGFVGMGKGRHGRNRIHEEKSVDDHEYDFPHLSDETMKKIKKLHNKTDEVAPPGGEKLVKALKKQPGVKNPWAIAWSKYNKGELKENNKVTIGQLRQIIREELLKFKK